VVGQGKVGYSKAGSSREGREGLLATCGVCLAQEVWEASLPTYNRGYTARYCGPGFRDQSCCMCFWGGRAGWGRAGHGKVVGYCSHVTCGGVFAARSVGGLPA
jgi:hypothetical protein